jgi:hypothetical protein
MAAAETWGNLMSIIKAYNTLENLLVILHRKKKHPSISSDTVLPGSFPFAEQNLAYIHHHFLF